ncbi:hypothetical protein CC2G_000518 [Coprinopsis cinerea AmutBmut pab1-1]|nr:hypothetical protein CC2G_000518 [Coprinopsis cinerea AmutBmut pab1-1]
MLRLTTLHDLYLYDDFLFSFVSILLSVLFGHTVVEQNRVVTTGNDAHIGGFLVTVDERLKMEKHLSRRLTCEYENNVARECDDLATSSAQAHRSLLGSRILMADKTDKQRRR